MIKDGKGGANTVTGLEFEKKTDLSIYLREKGFEIEDDIVYYNGEKLAHLLKKHNLYKFLKQSRIDWEQLITKQILPDDSIYVFSKNTLYVIECKHQQVAGSVDEKLQTCEFKKNQYQKLMTPLGANVKYIYLLSDWFKDPKYKDVLEFIKEKKCYYFFDNIPLEELGLPQPLNRYSK